MTYEEYKDSLFWALIDTQIKSFENNQDLKITTKHNYITGAIVKGIHEDPVLIEKIAESLWKIHSHSLYPYYTDKKENEESWEKLFEDEIDQNEVSKKFFRRIAKKIFIRKG